MDDDAVGDDTEGTAGEVAVGENATDEDAVGESAEDEDAVGEDTVNEDAEHEDAVGEDTEGAAGEDAEGEDAIGKDTEHEDTAKHRHLSISHPAGLLQHHSAEVLALHYNQFACCPVQATSSLKISLYEGRMLPQVARGPASSRWSAFMVEPFEWHCSPVTSQEDGFGVIPHVTAHTP